MPVYLDDSPGAEQALGRIVDLAQLGNVDEACRVLQELLVRDAERVMATPRDADLFISVRRAAHEVLLSRPVMLERYRALEGGRARAMLDADLVEEVERSRLYTSAGLEAVLILAQREMESARFASAWRLLMQAEEHPDRRGELGRVAAVMAGRIAAYLDDGAHDGASERSLIVERWSREAGMGAPADAIVERPRSAPVLRIFDQLDDVDLTGVLSRPMASVRMGDPVDEVRQLSQELMQSGQMEVEKLLHATPTLSGDLVYLNDSQTISAWDRFTLTPVWRIVVSSDQRPNSSFAGRNGLEDLSEAIPSEGRVVALTGLSLKGRPTRDRVLACLDAQTGRLVWSQTTERGNVARDPGEGEFRGPLLVDAGVVVLTISREVTHQRLRSTTLVGYDLHTGQRLWSRPFGSVGQQMWAATPETSDAGVIVDGVVYRSDRIGVVGAVELRSGRVVWLRRVVRQDNGMSNDPGSWVSNIPVVHDGSIIVMSPDRARVLEIDRESGEVLRSVQSSRLENPDYLLRYGELLVGVSRDSIVARPLASWWDAELPTYGIRRVQGGIRGRVLVAGRELIVPLASGIGRIEASYSESEGFAIVSQRVLELDEPGMVLVAEGQLLVVDDVRAHSYLSWDSASSLLSARMEEMPTDPTPAITYAELSYRADRPDRILWATDRALRAIERDPLSDASVVARERLFGSLLDMVEPAPDAPMGAALSTEQRDGIIGRLSRLATNPEQQVAALLAAARFDEASERPERAVERYQQILGSPALARSMARSHSMTLPAEVAASRRLERLVRIEGRRIYSAYDAEALRLLEEASPSRDPEIFEGIARRYPVSVHTARAWLEGAVRHEEAGDDRAMLFALEAGFRAGENLLDADNPTRAELNGRLLSALIRLERLEAALERLEGPGSSMLTVDGVAIDVASLSEQLRQRLEERRRRAIFGPSLGRTWIFEQAAIVEPLDRTARDVPTDRVLLRRVDGTIEMWRVDDEEGISRLWQAEMPGEVLRFDRTGVYLSTGPERTRTRSIVRLEVETGELLWRTRSMQEIFERGDEERVAVAGAPPRIDTPMRSSVSQDEVLAVFDRRSVALVQRSGKMAGFDIESGRLLWAHRQAPDLVHEAAAGSGMIAVVGTRASTAESPRLPDGEISPFENAMLVFDIRTGDLLATHRETPSQVMRWVRVDDRGLIFAGVSDSILAFDASRRSVLWRTDRPSMRDTVGCWFVPGGVVVLDLDANLHLIGRSDGVVLREQMEVPGRLPSNSVRVEVVTLDKEHFVVGTGRNVGVFDATGAPIGIDASERLVDTGLTPVIGDGFIATIDRASIAAGPELRAYPLQMFELPSCRAATPIIGFELGAPPRNMVALDGRLLISAGGVTIVLEAMPDPIETQ